ncbi:ribbon-helix-helix protein, CopG family [Thalassospira sp. NFXS8]|uniref:ribbon-helix-helix protein, CopG family n=1 Tax=Thalassospira sp. NFXS8 TaxID=2819093 RepID=UPI0032DF9CE2
MATTRNLVKTYLDDIELARLDRLAGQLRLSRSELLRRLLMNSKLPDQRTFEASHAILDLLRVNADQARLGNLFKLALDEPLSADLLARFDRLIVEITTTQNELKSLVREIDSSLHRKAS